MFHGLGKEIFFAGIIFIIYLINGQTVAYERMDGKWEVTLWKMLFIRQQWAALPGKVIIIWKTI